MLRSAKLCAALDLGSSRIRAAVPEREAMVDRPSAITTASPIRYGMVADADACARLVRLALLEANPGAPLREIVLAVPVAATGTDRRRAVAAVRAAAGCSVRTVEAPVAAAIGAGLPANGPHPYLITDIGAGIIEAAVILDGEVVLARSMQYAPFVTQCPSGTDSSSPSRSSSPSSASAVPGAPECPRDRLQAEPPRYVTARLAAELRELLDDLPARLRVQVRGHGLLLTGGGARLPYLPGWLATRTGLTVTVAYDPARATIRGLARL